MLSGNLAWIEAALRRPVQHSTVPVEGGQVACSEWQQSTDLAQSGVLLIHGNGASRSWWDAVAPGIQNASRIVAFDLSGHGDSSWLPKYAFDQWVIEALAVLDRYFGEKPVTLVGHSMGGLISLLVAWKYPHRVKQVIALDTPLKRYSSDALAKREGIAARPLKKYPNLEQAIAAFKTVPPTPDAPQALWNHVAKRSFNLERGEYARNIDPKIYARKTKREQFLVEWPCETVLVRAQHGLIDPEMAQEIQAFMGRTGRIRNMPGVGHNLILQEPAKVAMMIDEIIAETVASCAKKYVAPASGAGS